MRFLNNNHIDDTYYFVLNEFVQWNDFLNYKKLTKTAQKRMEMPGIEPGAFHMQSERSTTEPHPQLIHLVPAMEWYPTY